MVPTISDAEWEVMSVVWPAAPMTANDIVARLEGRRKWSPRTVKTLLNRLVKKKALAFEAIGNRYLYRPAILREQCVRGEARSFVDRVFGGAVGPMLTHFVTQADLSPSEIEQLQQLLAAKGNRSSSKAPAKKGKNP